MVKNQINSCCHMGYPPIMKSLAFSSRVFPKASQIKTSETSRNYQVTRLGIAPSPEVIMTLIAGKSGPASNAQGYLLEIGRMFQCDPHNALGGALSAALWHHSVCIASMLRRVQVILR